MSSKKRGGRNSGKLEILFNPRLDHAVLFDDQKWTEPLVQVVRQYLKDI